MFKNASVFKIKLTQHALTQTLNDAAGRALFLPCYPTQERSVGWVSPRGHEHGPLVENIGGHLIMRLMIETKTVPTQAIDDAVAAKVKKIEETTGRKPGKKEMSELKSDARLALLPNAFAQRAAVFVWIDRENGRLVLDAAGQNRVDEVATQLIKLVDGVVIGFLTTQTSPAAAMTMWLNDHDALARDFSIGRSATLKATDESKAVVRYTRHGLDTDEVRQHIAQGKIATKLALTYRDRVAFTLTDGGVLTGLEFLDSVFEERADTAADSFDADVAILTGELSRLIPDLVEEMGGEFDEEGGAA